MILDNQILDIVKKDGVLFLLLAIWSVLLFFRFNNDGVITDNGIFNNPVFSKSDTGKGFIGWRQNSEHIFPEIEV